MFIARLCPGHLPPLEVRFVPCEPVQAVCRRRVLSLFIFLSPIFCAAKLLLFFDICKRLAHFFAFLRIFLKIRQPLDRKAPCAQIANKCPFWPFFSHTRARLYAPTHDIYSFIIFPLLPSLLFSLLRLVFALASRASASPVRFGLNAGPVRLL